MDAGDLDGAEGTKRAYVLRQIHDVIVSADLERRIQELEDRQGSGAGAMPALSHHRSFQLTENASRPAGRCFTIALKANTRLHRDPIL